MQDRMKSSSVRDVPSVMMNVSTLYNATHEICIGTLWLSGYGDVVDPDEK